MSRTDFPRLSSRRARTRVWGTFLPATLAFLTAAPVLAAPWTQAPAEYFEDNFLLYSRDVEVADLDGDGDLDLLFANSAGDQEGSVDSAQRNQAFIFDSDNNTYVDMSMAIFGEDPDNPGTQLKDTASSLAVFDYDNDSEPDILIGRTWGQPSVLLQNDGGLTFTDVSDGALPAVMPMAGDLEVGDVDEDGDLDVIVNDWGGIPVGINKGATQVWFNDGGVFSSQEIAGSEVRWSIDHDLVDVDNDWDLDLIIASRGTEGFLFLNDGDGGFTNAGEVNLGQMDKFTEGVEAMFIDDDGFIDLVTLRDGEGGGGGYRNRVLMNQGDGTFLDDSATYWPVVDNPEGGDRAAGFFDFGSDGDVDVLVASNNSVEWPDRLMIFDGQFTQDSAPFDGNPVTEGTQAFEMADLDGDTIIDVVLAAGENAIENTVFLGVAGENAEDLTLPAIPQLEEGLVLDFPDTAHIRARVHDYKTPHKPHDWNQAVNGGVWLEWAAGVFQTVEDFEAAKADVPSTHYGENLYWSEFDIPNEPIVSYRQCAEDAAGNRYCSEIKELNINVMETTTATETETETESETVTESESETETETASTTESTASATNTDTDSATLTDTTTEGSNTNTETDTETLSDTATETDSLGLDDDGCDCSTRDPSHGWSGLALLGLLAMRRRRRS